MTDNTNGDDDEGVPEPLEDEGPETDLSSFPMLSDHIDVAGPMMDHIAKAVWEPINQQLEEMREELREYKENVRQAIETTIDLEVPENYDPEKSEVHDDAQKVAIRQLLELARALEGVEDERLKAVLSRMMVGGEAYEGVAYDENGEPVSIQPRLHEAIFVFISLQDGLMYWLCEWDNSVDYDNPSLETYSSRTKKDVLKDRYDSYYGIAPNSLFDDNLDAFYQHRHSIMHGDFDAYFDKNIATAAVLFFALTLHTVLDVLEESTDYERDEIDLPD